LPLSTASITSAPSILNLTFVSSFGQGIPLASTMVAVTNATSSKLLVSEDWSVVRIIFAGAPAVFNSSVTTSFPLFFPTAF
jgi:hypothetical protein